MRKIAVIIYHPFRDDDYRVDVYDVPESMDELGIREYVMSKMLGPFKILSITNKISLNLEIETTSR